MIGVSYKTKTFFFFFLVTGVTYNRFNNNDTNEGTSNYVRTYAKLPPFLEEYK